MLKRQFPIFSGWKTSNLPGRQKFEPTIINVSLPGEGRNLSHFKEGSSGGKGGSLLAYRDWSPRFDALRPLNLWENISGITLISWFSSHLAHRTFLSFLNNLLSQHRSFFPFSSSMCNVYQVYKWSFSICLLSIYLTAGTKHQYTIAALRSSGTEKNLTLADQLGT